MRLGQGTCTMARVRARCLVDRYGTCMTKGTGYDVPMYRTFQKPEGKLHMYQNSGLRDSLLGVINDLSIKSHVSK